MEAIIELTRALNELNPTKGENATVGPGRGYASGSPSIPHDMNASIHRGEMIIPGSFADAIRRGDITIGGRNGMGSGTTVVNYNVTVQGSLIRERDVAKDVSRMIEKERQRGHVA